MLLTVSDPAQKRQPSQPYENHTGLRLRRLISIRSRHGRALRTIDVAVLAVPHVELVTDDRKEERVGAVEQLTVHDGMDAGVWWNPVRAAAVPAQSMAVFGFHAAPRPIIMGVEASAT